MSVIAAETKTDRRMTTTDMAYIAMFSALIAVCSWITVPMPVGVPFTLQTFAVFMAVGVLGGKRGTLSVILYILLGSIGLPVFSGFRAGVSVLLGTTGGYIVGFVASALLIWAIESAFGRKPIVEIIAMLIGLLVCYALGTIWFMVVYSRANGAVGIMTVLSWCVLPYIIPDLAKIAMAFLLAPRIRKVAGGYLNR